ncbi:MAG: hypothetical protein LC117_02210 [Bacteroidia bacterium]|nr:hypothetical protein [Bacteroidia bacterium]MCZ2276727.1 hypothetical protein [Bacteroidia bacterium]
MYIPFDQLPSDSKIIISQASEPLNDELEKNIMNQVVPFLENWTAHNNTLRASGIILHHLFLIISVDKNFNDISGCSIDTLFRFIQGLEKEFNISLLNRNIVAYQIQGQIELMPLTSFRQSLKNGKLPSDTQFFNNVIQLKSELENNWLTQVNKSWIAVH